MANHTRDKDRDHDDDEKVHGKGKSADPRNTPTAQAAGDKPIVPMDVGSEGVRAEGIEQPTVTALSPDTAVCGDAKDIVMIVEGTGFHPKSVITFGGLDEPTRFIDSTHVSTGVKPSLFLGPDAVPVAVRNAGFAASNEMPFTFTATAEGANAEATAKSKR